MIDNLIVFYLAAAGGAALVRMLVRGTLFYVKPFNCPLCMGFWIGISIAPYALPWSGIIDVFCYALGAAIVSWAFYKSITGES